MTFRNNSFSAPLETADFPVEDTEKHKLCAEIGEKVHAF